MTEREKIFDAFRYCITEPKCRDCPWEACEKIIGQREVEIPADLALAVMRMLAEQEPHVLTLEEMREWDGTFIVEGRTTKKLTWASYYDEFNRYDEEDRVIRMVDWDGGVDDRPKDTYNLYWRCWSARPTDALREATTWDEP